MAHLSGVEAIAAERQRQIDVEGWTPEHDDQWEKGELAAAGACYALSASLAVEFGGEVGFTSPPVIFPFDEEDWKPDGPLSDLVRAGALIAAQIDRLNRMEDE